MGPDNFYDDEFDEDFDFGDGGYGFGGGPPNIMPMGPRMPRRGRGFGIPDNDRYSNAYGSYRGGYGPGGGFGPPMRPPGMPGMRPPRPIGPPRPFRPPGPPGPVVMWGRGFGPEGPPVQRPLRVPPESRAFKYLLRCGVAKDIVKNLPKEMLLLMEPEYCGVCGMELDSFAVSRLHYTSRNHTKNQKKWVTQNMEFSGNSKTQAIPLKSRELYCELCDVHITSKTHAESHYAGKPHRAIIDGRKKPKNPFLLQKGMESRIDQLIRREKKNLKSVPKKSEKEEEAELKVIQPELYCDICKTSVTCSEQMTMHLNGKKHLTKEKQHIIRVMNGEVPEENKAEVLEGNNAEVLDGNNAEILKGNKEEVVEGNNAEVAARSENIPTEGTDDGDWENGSGAWE